MRQLIPVFAMTLCSCSIVAQKQSAVLAETSQRYAQASTDMTKEQLVQMLGPPRRQDAHRLMWEVRYSRENFESLTVELNSANQVVTIKGVHGRFRWGSDGVVPGFSDLDKVQAIGDPVTWGWEIPASYPPEEIYQPSNQALGVSFAIGRSASSFYRRNGRWPSGVEEIKGEKAWQELLPAISDYNSICFTQESGGSLTVTLAKRDDSRKLTIRQPKTKDPQRSSTDNSQAPGGQSSISGVLSPHNALPWAAAELQLRAGFESTSTTFPFFTM